MRRHSGSHGVEIGVVEVRAWLRLEQVERRGIYVGGEECRIQRVLVEVGLAEVEGGECAGVAGAQAGVLEALRLEEGMVRHRAVLPLLSLLLLVEVGIRRAE